MGHSSGVAWGELSAGGISCGGCRHPSGQEGVTVKASAKREIKWLLHARVMRSATPRWHGSDMDLPISAEFPNLFEATVNRNRRTRQADIIQNCFLNPRRRTLWTADLQV